MPLFTAYRFGDKDNPVGASKAVAGKKYNCPYCGAEVYRKTSSGGTDYFACYPGQIHTHRVCRHISDSRISHTIYNFKYEQFFKNILSSEVEHLSASGFDNKEQEYFAPHQPFDSGEESNDNVSDDFVERPLTRVSQLWDEGYTDSLKYNDKMGDLPAHEVVILPSFYSKSFGENDFQGGRRVILARLLAAYDNSQTITFACDWQSRNKSRSVYLRLKHIDTKAFKHNTDQLFRPVVGPNGTSKYIPLYRTILVTGNWKRTHDSKNGNKCFECTFMNREQIFICK